jgi:hypothetical protein
MPRMAVVHLMAESVQLRAKQARSDNRWARTLEWFANPNLACAEKVVGFNLLVHAGGAPGVLPRNPLSDVTPVVIAHIAKQCKLSDKQTGAHMDTLSRNKIIPIHQDRVVPQPKPDPKPAPQPAGPARGTPGGAQGAPQPTPKAGGAHCSVPTAEGKSPPFITVTTVLPIEGPDAAILHPAKIGPLTPSPRLQNHRKKEGENRQDTRKKLDRLKILEARCPHCGEIDPDKLSLHCHKCGQPTLVAEMPEAKRYVRWGARSRFLRREEPHPIDADGNPIPKAGKEQWSPPKAEQQEMFPAPALQPQQEVTTGAEIRAATAAQSSVSSQHSVGSAAEQCSDQYKT